MTTADGSRMIRIIFILALLQAPAAAQESPRDTPPPASPQNSSPADPQDEQAAEQTSWDSIENNSDPQEYRTFLSKYPRGRFAGAARARLSAMLGEDFVTLLMKRIKANGRWSEVEKQLERRAAIVTKLHETLVAAGVQEREFYGRVAEWRARLLDAIKAAPQGEGDAKTAEQKRAVMDADNGLSKALRLLGALPENYPQLRSNESFLKMLDELTGVENRSAVARLDYNEAAQDYNAARREPRMAELPLRHGFAEEPYFESVQDRTAEPKVNSLLPASTRHGGARTNNAARR